MNKVATARKVLKEALDSDEGLKICYVSNIAMLLHDRYGITNREKRTQAAEDILSLLFS